MAGPEVEEQCRQLGLPLAAPLAEGWALPARPRRLHLEKGPQGFGFLLREDKGPDGRLGEWAGGRGGDVGLGGRGAHLSVHASLGHLLRVPAPTAPQRARGGLGRPGAAVRMSVSQGSSCGKWTRDCPRRGPGCRLGTGWWRWLGRVWRGWATRRRCPGSGRRARDSP